MACLTTRDLTPCLGTPCNELGLLPSLGLPALEPCNIAYEMKRKVWSHSLHHTANLPMVCEADGMYNFYPMD